MRVGSCFSPGLHLLLLKIETGPLVRFRLAYVVLSGGFSGWGRLWQTATFGMPMGFLAVVDSVFL